VIFSIIFISYAHSSFIKSRQEEFGLFMSIGMSSKQILKLIVIENGLIAIASMITGIVTGAVFSRLFFLMVLKVLNVKGIEFYISYKSLLLTLTVFTIVFLMVILTSLITAYKLQPLQLLKSSRIAQRNKVSKPVLALIGIAMMVFSIGALCASFASKAVMDSETFLLLTLICLAGLYVSISQFGGLLLKLSKKSKKFYYRNLTLITGIDYRFKQTKKIIFTIAIMVMITTFYCGHIMYILSFAERTAIDNNPFDIAVLEAYNENGFSEADFKVRISEKGVELTEYKTLEILNVNELYDQGEEVERKVISVNSLNELTNSNIELEKGAYIRLYQYPEEEELETNAYNRKDLVLKYGELIKSLKNQEVIYKKCFNIMKYNYEELLVLNHFDYESFKSRSDSSNIEKMHLLNFKDWRKSWTVVSKLTKDFSKAKETSEADFIVQSKIGEYTYLKQSASLMLLICAFLGFFFFIASSVILSFKLFSEIDDERLKYKKLSTIGIKDIEIKKAINKELRLIFFLPLVLGASLSFLYIFAITRGEDVNTVEPLKFNLLVSTIYMFFQIAYYLILSRTYRDKIISSISDI